MTIGCQIKATERFCLWVMYGCDPSVKIRHADFPHCHSCSRSRSLPGFSKASLPVKQTHHTQWHNNLIQMYNFSLKVSGFFIIKTIQFMCFPVAWQYYLLAQCSVSFNKLLLGVYFPINTAPLTSNVVNKLSDVSAALKALLCPHWLCRKKLSQSKQLCGVNWVKGLRESPCAPFPPKVLSGFI